MPFIPIPHTAKVNFRLTSGPVYGTFGLYFFRTDFSDLHLSALIDALESEFATDLMSHLNDDYKLDQIEAYDLRAPDGFKAVKVVDIDGGSGAADTPLSPAVSLVVSFYAARRGKWNQGRNYVPGISEQAADQVDVSSGTTLGVLSVYQDLIADPPDGWVWVVASRYLNRAARLEGVTAPVQSVIVRSSRFGFQRRRAQRP